MTHLLTFLVIMLFLLMWAATEPKRQTNFTAAYITSLIVMVLWNLLR